MFGGISPHTLLLCMSDLLDIPRSARQTKQRMETVSRLPFDLNTLESITDMKCTRSDREPRNPKAKEDVFPSACAMAPAAKKKPRFKGSSRRRRRRRRHRPVPHRPLPRTRTTQTHAPIAIAAARDDANTSGQREANDRPTPAGYEANGNVYSDFLPRDAPFVPVEPRTTAPTIRNA